MYNELRKRGTRLVRSLKIALLIVACLSMAACVSIPRSELLAIGSTTDATDVNFTEIYAYAERSKAAYADDAAIRAKYPATIRVSAPQNKDVQYFLERNETKRTQYIVVRGTANKKNLAEDLKVKLRQDRKSDIPVHAGFDQTANAIYADARPHLKPDYKTYVTGHSLGGAIAAVLAIYLIEDGFTVERVVTFGQPRFTTAAGVQRLAFLPLTRVVDENDVIPMVPPATRLPSRYGAYEHVGPEIILLEGPNYVHLTAHDATRIDLGQFWRDSAFADLSDHHMDNYLLRLSSKKSGARQVPYNDREKYVAQKTEHRPSP